MHLERRRVHEETRPDELLVLLVVAQDVADVLAEKTLDALSEFLHAIDVCLVHPPRAVGRVGLARPEWLDLLLDAEVPRHVSHEIADWLECTHRLDGHGLAEWQLREPGHAHELGLPVDLGRTRSALAGLAVPADREVVRLVGLDLVNRVEDDHAFGDGRRVVHELAGRIVAAPHAERRTLGFSIGGPLLDGGGVAGRLNDSDTFLGARSRLRAHFISSMTASSSGGIGGIVTRSSCMEPSAAFLSVMLNVPYFGSLSG